jgi:hypothetical protein
LIKNNCIKKIKGRKEIKIEIEIEIIGSIMRKKKIKAVKISNKFTE